MEANISLDLKGLECPIPAIRTKRQLLKMQAGQVLYLECTDPLAAVDIPFVAQQLGHKLVSQAIEGDILCFWLQVGAAEKTGGEASWP